MTKKLPLAIIVIPTYNERDNISRLVPVLMDLAQKTTTWRLEVLVVDDTSPDKTYEVVQTLQKKYPRLHLLLNKEKSGLGGAYLKGITHAFTKLGADAIFEFDADFSHDPSRIPAFLAKLDEGYDFVIGGRYKDGGSIDPSWPFLRKFYSVVGNLVIMFVLTDFRIRDWTSGYRAIRKKTFMQVVPELKEGRFSGYTWQIGLLNKSRKTGARIVEVPIHFIDRQVGESKLGSEYIKNTLFYIFQVRFEEIVNSRVFKFALVGALGALVQLLAYTLLRGPIFSLGDNIGLLQTLTTILATELSIIVNFTVNNFWTFRDRQLSGAHKIIPQFLKFNLGATGSIAVQALVNFLGATLFGVAGILGQLYQVIGILIGMFLNYFIYNKFIWKTGKND